jgi:hypothetical protein
MPKRLYTLSPTPCTGASQDSDEITYLNHLLRKTLACRLLHRRKRYLPAGPEAVTPISVFWPNINTRTTGAVMGGSQSVPATASKVARRTKRPTGTPSWSFMPKLHDSVLERVQPLRINFHNVDDSIRPLRSIDTNIMGRFVCENPACSNSSWASNTIATNIQLYRENRYNARIFHQSCQSCETLCWPEVDRESYIKRVVHRLREWHYMEVEAPIFSKRKDDDGPHLSHLCEGCRAGHCKFADRLQSD